MVISKKYYSFYLLAIVIVCKFILQYFIVSPNYGLHRDEFLHLDQANQLQWGYPSLPPFTSWLAEIIRFFGGSIFVIRLIPAMAGALTIFIVWKMLRLLNASLSAMVIALFGLLFSSLLRLNMLFQPNSLDIFFYSLIFFFVVKYIKTLNVVNIYYLGISIGFGMLNKYNVIFLVISLICSLALSTYRKLFTNKHFWFSIIFSFIIFMPNILWQYQNEWPVIWHMNELNKTQLVNVSTSDFVEDQIKFFFSSIYIWVAGLFALLFFNSFKRYKVIGVTFVINILLFIFFHAKGYYAIGLYPMLFVFGSIFLDEKLKFKDFKFLTPIIVAINFFIFIYILPIAFPFKSPEKLSKDKDRLEKFGLLKWEDGKNHDLPQDFADMLGWQEMALKADLAYRKIPPHEINNTLTLANNYGETGAINYHSKYIKNAVSFNFDYINRFPDLSKVKHVISISDESREEFSKHFKLSEKIGEVENKFAREKGTTIYLFSYPNEEFKKKLNSILREYKKL